MPENNGMDKEAAYRLVGVDGIPIKVRGTVSVKVSLEGLVFNQKFVIADGITAEAILGMDFLEANRCVLDLCRGELVAKDVGMIPLQPHSSSKSSCLKVTLVETMAIPAASEMEVKARVCVPSDEHIWMIEGRTTRVPIRVARALVKPQNNLIPLHIVNTTLTPVTIYKGSTVAHAECVDEANINVVSENTEDGTISAVDRDSNLCNNLEEMLPEDINEDQKEKTLALLELYADVIASGDNGLGRTDILRHSIDTGNASPIRQQVRRTSLPGKEKVRELLKNMMQKKVISPSKSPWASPIVLVQKKDGSTRFCVDYRKINEVTRKDAYPIPRIDETLDTLAGATLFSTLDLRSGYWQVEMDPKDREKTAFCTPEGLFEFNVMPFGLCNAPATFQRLMDSILAGLHWRSCLVYIDDIVVIGKSFDEHLYNLQQVLERLRQAGLKLQPHKCKILQAQVTYLGHVVSAQGVSPDPEKTSKIKSWPIPQSAQEVQRFLGLANYCRFIKDFATMAKPLHRLTEKGVAFSWTPECENSFNSLKTQLSSAPILTLPNWSRPFILDTDASDTGIGAVLSQLQENGSECVVAYASRVLSKQERNYCVTRRELLAVVAFLQHFRQYLLGTPFTIRTDHSALTWLQNFKQPEGQLARWLEQLQEFEFTIIHRPGKAHCNADALSRRHCSKDCPDTHSTATIVAATTPIGYSHVELRQAQLEDPIIGEILQAKQGNCKPATEHAKGQNLEYRRLFQQWEQLTVSDGILWREYAQPREDRGWTQLVVPKKFCQDILRDLHEGVTGSHLGEMKTLSKLKERFYWPGHYNDVRDWCQTCKACAKRKSPVPGRQAPMHTITAGYPTQVMAVDLLGPLTESKNGNRYVLVIGDYFSR